MPRKRIGALTAGLLFGIAGLLDIIQFFVTFIPFVDVILDWFIAVIGLITFGIWFAMLDVNYFQGKKAAGKIAAVFGTAIVEMVPILDALPAITLGVLTVVFLTWNEDKAEAQRIAEEEEAQHVAPDTRPYARRDEGVIQAQQRRDAEIAANKERIAARKARVKEQVGYSAQEESRR